MVSHYSFQTNMRHLWSKLTDMGLLVEERVRTAIQCIEKEDIRLAEAVILSDYEIDELEIDIEELCIKIQALYQPVAKDLRMLMAAVKISGEMERIADMAVNIAERMKTIIENTSQPVWPQLALMCEKVAIMLKESLDGLSRQDIDLAHRVFLLDEDVDQMCSQHCERICAELNRPTPQGTTLLNTFLLVTYLERISDRAVNIAEDVVYMIEGSIVREKQYL